MKDGKAFSQLIEEYGAEEEEETKEEEGLAVEASKAKVPRKEKESKSSSGSSTSSTNGSVDDISKEKDPKASARAAASPLMSEEERNRGAVPMSVYASYLRHAGGIIWAPVIIGILTLMQGASGMLCSCSYQCLCS